jgi:iron complex outermembrane recepter protein
MRYLTILLTALVAFSSAHVFAADAAGSIQGKIVSKLDGKPVAGAEVQLAELRRKTRTGRDGEFEFTRVPAGDYTLVVRVPGFGARRVEVKVEKGETAAPVVEFDMKIEYHEEVVVTSAPVGHESDKAYQPASVLSGDYLDERIGTSLGDALSREAGVHAASFSPASGRPVVRGLGGDRVLILDNGIRTGDLSSASPDHAVDLAPELAQRIEVVRGPANLLFGSGAIGGVVNFIGHDIPETRPARPTGWFSFGADSGYESRFGNAGATAAAGEHMVFHADAARRVWNVLGTPIGDFFADSEITSGSAGVSFVGDHGFLGASFRAHDALYGIPIEEGLRVDMKQRAFNMRGAWKEAGPFEAMRFAFGARDYEHAEIEPDGEVGTLFAHDTLEGRAEFTHKHWGRLHGTFGVTGFTQDFTAEGDEAIVPRARKDNLAAFLYEEIAFEKTAFLLGARYESQDVHNRDTDEKLAFGASTFSAGFRYEPKEDWTLTLSASRAVKFPSVEELYTYGEHHATGTFEVGDPGLRKERGYAADLSADYEGKKFGVGVTLFASRLDDFIFQREDPFFCFDEDDETIKNCLAAVEPIPVLNFVNADAVFRGFEAHADLHITERLHAELSADYVWAELRETGTPLPHMPPMRASARLGWHAKKWWVDAEARGAARQTRVAAETETPGYATYNLYAGARFFAGSTVHTFTLKGENLSDKLWRNHVSVVKDEVPMAGRNVSLTYRLAF